MSVGFRKDKRGIPEACQVEAAEREEGGGVSIYVQRG